jgi:hypothetical protein
MVWDLGLDSLDTLLSEDKCLELGKEWEADK